MNRNVYVCSPGLDDRATLMVRDRKIGGRMDEIFMDDLRHSEEITVSHVDRRSWIERLAEKGARLITRLL